MKTDPVKMIAPRLTITVVLSSPRKAKRDWYSLSAAVMFARRALAELFVTLLVDSWYVQNEVYISSIPPPMQVHGSGLVQKSGVGIVTMA